MVEHDDQVKSSHSPESFSALFWEQQKKAVAVYNSKGMRWHPLIIKWCLYLKHHSSSAYKLRRSSGIISLPSQRTLCDYSNCIKAKAGFSNDVDIQLMRAADVSKCPDWHKYVGLLLDEMYRSHI